MKKQLRFLFLIVILLLAAACSSTPEPVEPTLETEITEEAQAPTEAPTSQPPTATPSPPLVIVLAPSGGDPSVQSQVEAQVSSLAAELGLRWQLRQDISAEEIRAEANFVIALPPQADINALVAGAPEVNFLAVNLAGAVPADNLILAQTPADLTEIEAFMGGYIGALITDDWRIGIITVEDGNELQRFTAFENGFRFFCGLCRPQYAPFYEYPFKLSLPADASEAEWRALADFMRDRLVRTVYVSPGAGGPDMLQTLALLDDNVIGSSPPPPGLEENWVASLRSEPNTAYADYIPRLLNGEAGLEIVLPIGIQDRNDQLFGLGRQRLAEETLADLIGGFILPGDLP